MVGTQKQSSNRYERKRRVATAPSPALSLQAKLLELDTVSVQRHDDAVFTFRPQLKQPPRTSYKRRKPWSADSEEVIQPIPASTSQRVVKQPWAVVRQSATAPPKMQAMAMHPEEMVPSDDSLTRKTGAQQPPALEFRGRSRGESMYSDYILSGTSDQGSHVASTLPAQLDGAGRVTETHLEQESLTELRVAYAGNPNWKQGKLGSQFFVPYSRCAQAIVNREHLLVLLQDAISSLEQHYFLYAARRVELAETNNVDDTSGTTSHLRSLLFVKEEAIKRLQVQFRQLLKAVQSATVEVVDAIRAYRAVPGVKVFNQDPTFVWKGQNYLLKMSNDLDILSASHVIRLWLGCHPPGYVPRSVDASTRYALGSNALLYVWPGASQSPFALRDEQMRRLDAWKHFVASSRRAAIARARALSTGESSLKGSKAGRKTPVPARQENAVPQITRAVSSSSGLVIPPPPAETSPVSPALSQPSGALLIDLTTASARSDIDAIRRTCLSSWSDRSSIWQDLHESSVLMEATVGFKEVQPKAPLRPTVNIPHPEYQSVLQYIQRERATTFQIAQDAQNMTALRLHLRTYERDASLPTPIPLVSDEAASYLVRRRSTPAHQSRSPSRRQALSAPQLNSPSMLDTHSFFLTAGESPALPETKGRAHLRNTLRTRSQPSPRNVSVAEFCANVERNDAAVKVQKLVRQWLARRHLLRLRDLETRKLAATAIQSRVRGMLERANTAASRSELQISALGIRNQWKQKYRAGRLVIKAIARLRARRLKRVRMQRLIESETQGPRRVKHNAALDIQRVYRGYLARRRVKSLRVRRRLYYAARKINHAARIWLQRRELARESAHLLRSASRHRSLALQKARTIKKGGSLVQPE